MRSMVSDKKAHLGSVMVIGGCGFLGHHVVRLLLRDYTTSSISVIDLQCIRNRRPDSDGVNYFDADITNAERLKQVFEQARPDAVIHTASPAPQATNKFANDLFKKVNVGGTQTVVDVAKAAGVKVLVYTSSASIVSDNLNDLINADERWPIMRGKDQTEYYSETKAAAEEIVLAANNNVPGSSRFLTCAIRPAGIVGEGDTMALKHIIGACREGKTGFQIGDNNNLFDFTYVENVAHGHLLAAHALLATYTASTVPLNHERVDGEAFFITNDEPIYFWDFARAIWAAVGLDKGIDHVWVIPRSAGMVLGSLFEAISMVTRKPPSMNRQRLIYSCMTRYYNIGKAKARLGYQPLVPLDQAIKQSVKWFLDQEAAVKGSQ